METRASYVLLGAFVLGLIAAGVVFLLWVSGSGGRAGGIPLTVEFRQDVTGLNNGAVVRYRGIPVGTVQNIRLDPDNPERVLVGIVVIPEAQIYPDFEAALEQQGLTGIPFIQLKRPAPSARRPDSRPVAAGAMSPAQRARRIPGTPTNLQRLIEEVPRAVVAFRTLAERATVAVDRLETAFGGPEGKGIGAIVRSLDKAAGEFAAFSAEARAFAKEARAVAGDLRPAAKELSGAIGSVRTLADKAARLTDRAETVLSDRNRKRLENILDNVEKASEDASRFVREAEKRAKELEPTFRELPNTLDNLAGLSRSATELTDRASQVLDDTNRQRVDRILGSAEKAADDVKRIARETREVTEKIRPSIEKLGASLSQMADTVAKIDEGAEAFSKMSRDISRLVEENRRPVARFLNAGLYDVSQFVAEGRRLMGDLNRLVRRIESDPSGFFFGRQGGLDPRAR
ncbi:MAG: MlaD family protein [Rhodospirillaceae bacterium]|nr:MlaD family protein [Rhodospirillaceae bacterium]